MIITKTPYRISFFGGGTDYPVHYLEHGGSVLATSINKYCYISCRKLPPFFDHKFRISYSSIENANSIDEIIHPSVREVLRHLNVSDGLEIHHDGDLPARSGLGSSSSFTCGLLNAVHALNGRLIPKLDLALQAINVEQNLIGENVGSQDQITSAVGGFNRVNFHQDASIDVQKIILNEQKREQLNEHLLMFFSGFTRNSQTITSEKVKHIERKTSEVKEIGSLVDDATSILSRENINLEDFGRLLHESWIIKRNLYDAISNSNIDRIYQIALNNGALGGKLMGAGGGGFMLFFVPPDRHSCLKKALSDFVHVPFRFENGGSTVCVNEPNGF